MVSAKERKTKRTEEKDRVNWKLLTDMPIETFEQALAVVHWYQARWNIEIYFKTLKSGFGLEKRRLRHVDRMKKFGALVGVLAWRVFRISKLSRDCPRTQPMWYYDKKEIEVLQKIEESQGRRLSISAGCLTDFTVAVARLGAYLARKSDPPPGNIVIWRGLQRLHDIVMLQV